jgi:hypothetical protein
VSISFRVTAEPSIEPVTLTEMEDYLRVDSGDDDTQITRLITAARKYCEHVTGRAFATQSILAQFIIDRPGGGVLSGPIDDAQENFYHYEQQLGANPFGISQFFFELPMTPLQSIQSVGTQFTVFNVDGSGNPLFTNLPQLAADGITVNWSVDTVREPGRIYFQAPLIVYRWQFTYTSGYTATYPLPWDLKQTLMETIAYWYDHREGDELPDGLKMRLVGHRVDGGV